MTLNGWLQILFFLLALLLVTPIIGGYMARVFTRQRTWLDPVLRPVERLVYRLTGVDETREMRWTGYAVAVILFGIVSMLVLYAMQRLQQRQQCASVREPDAALELPGDVRHLRHLRGLHLHARFSDRLAAARLGRVGRDGVPLSRGHQRRLLGGSAGTRC